MNTDASHKNNKQNISLMFKQMKAEQLGVNVRDLKEQFHDGKRMYSVKGEKESTQKKRRHQRSIRGSHSLVDDINERLMDTEFLIKDLEEKGLIVGMESYDLFDKLGTIANKTESSIHPLIELEEQIVKNKKSVPDFNKHYQTFHEIQKLRQTGDLHAAEDMEKKQGGTFREFRLLYRTLVPLYNQARELRISLLREKRRLLCLQHQMMRRFLSWQVSEIRDMIEESDCDCSQFDQYMQGLKPWENMPEFSMTPGKQGIPVGRQIAILEDDIQKLSDQVDDALPSASEFIDKIRGILQSEIERDCVA